MLIHIQILRFIAAAAVVAFHVWDLAPRFIRVPEDTLSFGLWHAGHGVDLFFVISGFIIFYANRRGNVSPARFLRRRIERIVPLYFVVSFAVIAAALLLPQVFSAPDWYTPRHILKSLAFIAFTDGGMPVVYVGWSLEYEMYFYLVVALLMAAMRDAWRGVVMVFAALVAIGQIPGVAEALGVYSFFTDPLILEFVFGVIVGDYFVSGRPDPVKFVATASAFIVLLITDPFNRAIVFGLPSALLVAAAAVISRHRVTPSWFERALARLGDASYAMYLAQVETVTLTTRVISTWWPTIPPHLLVVLIGSFVLALGLLLNIAVERPLLQLCRRFGGDDTALAAKPVL